jgi:hypothetical protein
VQLRQQQQQAVQLRQQQQQAAQVAGALKLLLATASQQVSPALAVQLKERVTVCLRTTAAAAAASGKPFDMAAVLTMLLPSMQATVQAAICKTAAYDAAAAAAAAEMAASFKVQVTSEAAVGAGQAMSDVIVKYIVQCNAAAGQTGAAAAAAATAGRQMQALRGSEGDGGGPAAAAAAVAAAAAAAVAGGYCGIATSEEDVSYSCA